ncbi:MAG: hypothetical protein FJW40_06685 [Acidobacteria bacterium]|nr:hypothetical protein [Acidobacteriota bacterium]
MKKLVFAVVMCLALFVSAAAAAEWTGHISESGCGAKHADGSEKSIACVKGCVKKGAAPVFVVDGQVLKIADASKVMDHLGHKVTIKGTKSGDTVTIESVSMAH